MARNHLITGLLAATFAAAGLAACGADTTGENIPAIEFTIDGQYTNKKEFLPDQTGGQLSDLSVILIRNTGSVLNSDAPPPVLTIASVQFITDNPYLKMKYPKGDPGGVVKLAVNETLEVHVTWKPDPNDENNKPAQMIIKHDDEAKGDIKLDFKVLTFGARIVPDSSELVFINPSEAAPPTQCVTFGNEGNAKLVFKKAIIASAKPFYTVIKRPDEGATIDALGQGDNPKANKKKLEVCVRLAPAGKDQDYDDALQIESSDLTNPKIKIKLRAQFTKPAVYNLSCDNPLGAIMYDFAGVGPGSSGVATCNVANEGPGGFVVKSVQVKALATDQQQAVDDMYEAKTYKVNGATGDKEYAAPTTTVAIGEDKTRYFEVTLTHPNDAAPLDAMLVINFTQANVSDSVVIPISAGKCKSPSLQAAPVSSNLWLRATIDKPGKGIVMVANQSCAPLQIIKLCTAQQNPASAGADPCQNATLASAHFKAFGKSSDGTFKNDGLHTVPQWSLYPIEVALAPPDDQYPNISHLLNIRYCPAEWANDKCVDPEGKAVGLSTQTVTLAGLIEQKAAANPILQPTLKIGAASGSEAVVGQPFKLEAAAEDGTWPIAQYGAYLWMVAERPKGSKMWLADSFQTTDHNWITIKPDMAGAFKIIGMVQSYDPANPANIAWSEQVVFDFTAK